DVGAAAPQLEPAAARLVGGGHRVGADGVEAPAIVGGVEAFVEQEHVLRIGWRVARLGLAVVEEIAAIAGLDLEPDLGADRVPARGRIEEAIELDRTRSGIEEDADVVAVRE